MESKLAEVQKRLGARPGLREAEIRETLWYYYFDVDESVAWLAGRLFITAPLTRTGKYKKAHVGKSNNAPGTKNSVNNEGRHPLRVRLHSSPSM